MAMIALALYTETMPIPVSKRDARRINGLQRCTHRIDNLKKSPVCDCKRPESCLSSSVQACLALTQLQGA
jgi:hypothetical protein